MRIRRLLGVLLVGFTVVGGEIRNEFRDSVVTWAVNDFRRCMSAVRSQEFKAIPLDLVLRTEAGLAPQEWHLVSDGKTLTVSGCDAVGVVYGLYAFLEKHAGCLWPAPDTEVLPPQPAWTLPVLDERGKPAFVRREMYVGTDYMDGTWRLRNKENRRAAISMSCGSPRDSHTFASYEKALKGRPDLFFTSISGHKCTTLCMTHPEVRELVLQQLIRYIEQDRARLKGKPAYHRPVIYDISQNDGGSGAECWCENCRKLAEQEGSYSGPNLVFVNWLARKIRDRYPEIMLRTFAYSYTTVPPKQVKAEDNVIVQLCKSSPDHPLVRDSDHGRLLESWGKHARNKAIWSYWKFYSLNYEHPYVKSRKDIAEELRFCRDQGVIHYFAEAESPLSRSFAMLQHWLMLKMLENPDQDIMALSRTFMEAYYGKAAGPMMAYLAYLEGRQEQCWNREAGSVKEQGKQTSTGPEPRFYLDRDFFEKANRWLDEAERLTADEPRARQHVRWERVVVDRAMFNELSVLLAQGYKVDTASVLSRFERNGTELISSWCGLRGKDELVRQRCERICREASVFRCFPIPPLKQFSGCEVVDRMWNQIPLSGPHEYVPDSDAVCGIAFRNPKKKHRFPFVMGFYYSPLKRGESLSFSQADIPQDEKFHLYKIGNTTVAKPLIVYYDETWVFRTYLSVIGVVPSAWDVWVSIKFTGPFYVPGSKSENAVLFDRLVFVKDRNPLSKYEPVDLARNLVRNGGFEEPGAGVVPGWGGKPSQYHDVDRTVSHSGRSSLRIGKIPTYWDSVPFPLGKVEELKHDLLIRGWYKYEGVQNAQGCHLPFIGIAMKTRTGANSYTKALADFYPGNRDWQRFEKIVEAETLRRVVHRYPQPKRPYYCQFQVGLCYQPGTVWLDDVEIIPLVRKEK